MTTYRFRENGNEEDLDAKNLEEAKALAIKIVKDAYADDEGKAYIDVYVYAEDDPDNEELLEVLVGKDELEPDCLEDRNHEWCSPEWLGGCAQNPGVWATGGTQIHQREVCCHCGAY